MFSILPGRNPGTSTNVTIGILNASKKRTNRAAFVDASMSKQPKNKKRRQEKIKHEDFQILLTRRKYRNFAENKKVEEGKVKSGKEDACRLLCLSLVVLVIVSSYCQSLFILHTCTIL